MTILLWAAWAAIVMLIGSICLLLKDRVFASDDAVIANAETEHDRFVVVEVNLACGQQVEHRADDLNAAVELAIGAGANFRSRNKARNLPSGNVIRDPRLTRPLNFQNKG